MSVEEWEQPLEEPNQGNENTISRWPQSSRYLLRTITRAPLLRAAGADPWDGLKISLTKLAQNAVVNPLTALFECRNGELQHTIPASRLMHMLLAEISLVYRSLPEATPIKFRGEYFSPHKLRSEVLELCQNTAENHSSMLQDIQAGRETEIDYINGWIVKRGEELGIKCVVNFTVQQMVKAKSIIHNKAVEGSLPIEIPPDKESLPE
jgi:2-dehydropantoate 2-reductase